MTRKNAHTKSAVRRLRRAFDSGTWPNWPAAYAAILAGAPVDTPIPSWSWATPLIIAARNGCATEAIWLLDHGAILEAKDSNGDTALIRAVGWDRHAGATVAPLLDRGADPNARDRDGRTVLMMANWPRDAQFAKTMIATIIDHGADPSATIPDGHTAPEIFMVTGRPYMAECLDEVLADAHRAAVRRRLLDKLSVDQRAAWLPKSCAAEAAMTTSPAWCRP